MSDSANYVQSGSFHIKASTEEDKIFLQDNVELSNEFKQKVCLPYFKDLFKVI